MHTSAPLLIAVGLCALLCTSCRVGPYEFFPVPDTSPVIARVGNTRLTLNKLDASIPPELAGALSEEQKAAFVKQWIDAEILYQSALMEKIDADPMVRDRLALMRRSVLGAEMVGRLSSRIGEDARPSDSAVAGYYELHKTQFTRAADAVRFADIVMADRTAAMAVRNAVTPDNFFELAKLHSSVPLPADPGTIPFVVVGGLQRAIADVVFGIKIGGTTSPIQAPDGYHIIRVIDKQKAGDILPLAEVRGEIVSALSADVRKQHMDRQMADLRQKIIYEINLSNLSGDAGKGQ